MSFVNYELMIGPCGLVGSYALVLDCRYHNMDLLSVSLY